MTVQVLNRRKGGVLRWIPRLLFLALVAGALGGAGVAVGAYVHFSRDLPEVPSIAEFRPPTVSHFYAHDGRLLGEFTTERRLVVPLARMPAHLVEAFLAAEDKRFFAHDGVDVRATVRALLANYTAGRTVSGASTITQQVAKTLVGREKSYRRKAREAILARRMEHRLRKLDILHLYLNTIYLGHGAYGVQAAAQNYFREDVGELSLAESAMLAGLPPSPGRLNPVLDLEASKQRQRYVLDRMVEAGFVTEAEADAAHAEPLTIYPEWRAVFDERTPYFTEQVRKHVQETHGYDALNSEGLRVWATVDVDRQTAASDALQEGLRDLAERQGYVGPLRTLKPDEVEPFLKRASAHYQGPETLTPETWYLGVVTAAEKSAATVRIGDVTAALPLKSGMRWAAPYDPEDDRNGRRLSDATEVLGPGDVVWVRLNRGEQPEDGPPRLALTQEPVVQGALVSLDPHAGEVRAMVGGYDFDQSEYNRAFQGCRQPGSVFKPIVYSLALAGNYTLATTLSDTPITVYDQKRQFLWKPKNYGGRYKGEVLLRDALIRSMNIPAIRVQRHVGAEAAVEWAARLGISTPMHPSDALVLGSSCVYPWDMVQVFGVFALRGRKPNAAFVKRVLDRDGQVLEDRTHFTDPWAPLAFKVDGMLRALHEPRERVLDEDTAFLMQTALRQVVQAGTAVKAKKLGKPAAGKTGTTDKYDAWFVGFTESLVTGVWVGSDRNERKLGRGETGGKAALPIWVAYMKAALDGVPQAEFTEDPPAGVLFARIDRESGLLAPPGNPSLHLPFRSGTEPVEEARRAGSFDHRDLDLIEGRF